MTKKKASIIAVGDWVDYDSFEKFHRERPVFRTPGLSYRSLSYRNLLTRGPGRTPGDKAHVFLFFPFEYWNSKIETSRYKGVYGNKAFYEKFKRFFGLVERSLNEGLKGRVVQYVNPPLVAAGLRDRIKVMKALEAGGVSTPGMHYIRNAADIYRFLKTGRSLFVKVRYGSMGKGITYVSPSVWKTNFSFRRRKILSRKSDRGWRFRDIVRREDFIDRLLGADVYCEEAIDSHIVRDRKFDLRIYVFYGETVFIYPRTADPGDVTTNISQGGRGERPRFLRALPERLIRRVKAEAVKVTRVLGLNFAGVDVIADKDLEEVYVLDVNMFPGFPRKDIFNLGRRLALKLKRLASS